MEHYLLGRYYHYAGFITHKTITAAEITLAAAMLELIRAGELPADIEAVRALVGSQGFLDLDDALIWHLLRDAPKRHGHRSELVEACRSLTERTLLKCAYRLDELEEVKSSAGTILDHYFETPERQQDVANKAGVPVESFCYWRSSRPLVGIGAHLRPSAVAPGSGLDLEKWTKAVRIAEHRGEPELLVERGGLLAHLSTRSWDTRRVYVREPDLNAEDEGSRQHWAQLRAYLKELLAGT